jgi:hypothetical protein
VAKTTRKIGKIQPPACPKFGDLRLWTNRESHRGCELSLVSIKGQEGRRFQQPCRCDVQNIEGPMTAAQGVKLGKTRSLGDHGRKIQRHKLKISGLQIGLKSRQRRQRIGP